MKLGLYSPPARVGYEAFLRANADEEPTKPMLFLANEYPFCSKATSNGDLPLIPADIIKQRTGKHDSRLCTISLCNLTTEALLIERSLGIVIDTVVYDCSSFVGEHPGGETVIRSFGGQSCSCGSIRRANLLLVKC